VHTAVCKLRAHPLTEATGPRPAPWPVTARPSSSCRKPVVAVQFRRAISMCDGRDDGQPSPFHSPRRERPGSGQGPARVQPGSSQGPALLASLSKGAPSATMLHFGRSRGARVNQETRGCCQTAATNVVTDPMPKMRAFSRLVRPRHATSSPGRTTSPRSLPHCEDPKCLVPIKLERPRYEVCRR
jgi:hypothetical protein